MIKLNTPEKLLKKNMYHLILDNQADDIKLLLFKRRMKIPELFRAMKSLLEDNKIFISPSYFKNMLMNSSSQECNLDTRIKVVSLIFEYLDADKINAAYEGVRFLRDKKIRSYMRVLKKDHIDKNEYLPHEVIMHALENLPEDRDGYWEIEQEEKSSL
jgi:hypothetical protein